MGACLCNKCHFLNRCFLKEEDFIIFILYFFIRSTHFFSNDTKAKCDEIVSLRSTHRRVSPASSSHLKSELKSVTVNVCVCVIRLRYTLRRISYSWCEDTSHHAGGTRNTSYTSHHSSAVTKQHDRIKGRGKRGAGERTCVGRGEGCAKIKGCRQSEAMCLIVLTQYPPTPPISESSPLPSGSTEDPTCAAETTCWEKFSSCWRDSAVLLTVNLQK